MRSLIVLKPQDFEVEAIRELFTTINTHGKFPNSLIKENVISLLKSLDDDLDAMEYGPSQGSNSAEEALEALQGAVSDYEESQEEVEVGEDDYDPEVEEDEDEPEAPTTDKPPTPPSVPPVQG